MSSAPNAATHASGRRPTVRDVARAAGVSPATVSNVLNHPQRVKPQKLEAVQQAIKQLEYVPSESARQLRSGKSRTIGLVLLDAWNPAFADMARGVEDELSQGDWTLLVSNSARSLEREREYLNVFEERQVAGIIFVPKDVTEFTNGSVLVSSLPVVAMDSKFPPDTVSSVMIDDVAGGQAAMRHLLDLGHRKIVFIGDPAEAQPIRNRLEGAAATCRAVNYEVDFEVLRAPLTIEGGAQAAELLLQRSERPTAIIAAIDLIALGAIQVFQTAGVQIPQEISVCGYDDMDFSSRLTPSLTTVRRPHYEMGKKAAKLLTSLISNPRRQPVNPRLLPSLMVRGSTAHTAL